MAKITSSKRGGKAPDGYDKVEPTISKLLERLKDAKAKHQRADENKRSLWKILQINHQISRYIYTMHYERHLIDEKLYKWLLRQKYCNADLIAKWKKQGYEQLCCLNCIVTDTKNYKTTCICRVPKSTLQEKGRDEPVECITCGCKGCASTD